MGSLCILSPYKVLSSAVDRNVSIVQVVVEACTKYCTTFCAVHCLSVLAWTVHPLKG